MDVEELESQLTSGFAEGSSLNSLRDLLSFTTSDDPQLLYKSIFALYRVFTVGLKSPYYSHRKTVEIVGVQKWLEECLEEFVELLTKLLAHSSVDIRVRINLLSIWWDCILTDSKLC